MLTVVALAIGSLSVPNWKQCKPNKLATLGEEITLHQAQQTGKLKLLQQVNPSSSP